MVIVPAKSHAQASAPAASKPAGKVSEEAAVAAYVRMMSRQAVPTGMADYAKAADAPGYAKAAAHAPAFSDTALWPKLTGKEGFAAQAWPKARLLIWDIDAKRWMENGQPADAPPDESTDVVFPDSDKPYAFAFTSDKERSRQVYRHITVGRNASFKGGGDGLGRAIHGNVWIKKGGSMYAQGATQLLSDKDTFFRNDNVRELYRDGWGRIQRDLCSQYFTFNKGSGSIEFLGYVAVLDEFNVHSGTVIVGPDSKLMPGRNASPSIRQGAALALMDGAVFMKWANEIDNRDMDCGGAIQGGLSGRPLTRPATYFLAHKNLSGAQYDGPGAEQKKGQRLTYQRTPSLILRETAILRSYTADAAKARLRFAWSGYMPGGTWKPYGPEFTNDELKKEPEVASRYKWFESLPTGISIFFAKGVGVDRVEFDDVAKGGLLLEDESLKAAFKDVVYGPGNRAKGDDLFQQAKLGRSGNY
jgi:hypothetical protein